ncbi:extracellular solute-binding protein [Patescibacteria group bacterium]|nr:extracellular solute-binding protein [Patescibacteria group bacterium]
MKGNFQTILIIGFIVAALLGILVFSGAIKIGNDTTQKGALGTVVLWGTVKTGIIATALDDFNRTNQSLILKYVQKDPETFDQDLLEALASGVGPDLFFLPDNLAFHYKNRIFPIPYESYSLASFKNNFAGAGEVFLTSKGILAFPIAIDPLVMYYNRSMLDANSIVYPPTSWDEFTELVPSLTKKDENKKIIKSATALGQFSNITNAKDIISTLFMQAGNPILSEEKGYFISTLGDSGRVDLGPILGFYTDFSNPLKESYSWNRSLPDSQDFFSADGLAFYFGYAGELKSLINKNPNLNFLPAPVPQIKNSNFKLTSARVTGVAVSSFSKNLNTAFIAASLLANSDFASKFANALNIAPARRDLLALKPTDAYFPIFYSSALYAKAWLDPSPEDTDDIFRGMVENVLSNKMTTYDAVKDASAKLNLLLVN